MANFEQVNWKRKVLRYCNIFLAITFALGINYLAASHYTRKDITHNRSLSLSPESLAFIRNLQAPVKLTILAAPPSYQSETAQIYTLVTRLAQEYVHNSKNNETNTISVETINPYTQSQRAHQIVDKFSAQQDNIVIIESKDHFRVIPIADLFTFKEGQIENFKAEQVFGSAIIEVTEGNKNTIAFTQGHGEMQPQDVDPFRGLSQTSAILKSLNLDTQSIDLAKETIPQATDILIVASPQTNFLQDELEKIESFLCDHNGHVIILLDPAQTHNFHTLLLKWGVLADNRVVINTPENTHEDQGNSIIRHFYPHPINQFLIDNKLSVLTGPSRPVLPIKEKQNDPTLSIAPLLATAENAWAKPTPFTDQAFNPSTDIPGPVPIAFTAQRTLNSKLGIDIQSGKLIVFGNCDFISNNKINTLGNTFLLQNTLNWCLNRDIALQIPPKNLKKYQLSLNQADLKKLSLALSFLPASLLLFSILIYTVRKR